MKCFMKHQDNHLSILNKAFLKHLMSNNRPLYFGDNCLVNIVSETLLYFWMQYKLFLTNELHLL